MSDTTSAASGRGIDTGMMRVVHDAFQRDLDALASVVEHDAAPSSATSAIWPRFKAFLHIHHTAEDTHLWPILRGRLADDPARLALLDQMETEHTRLTALLDAVDAAMTAGARSNQVGAHVRDLADALTQHCDHEEALALPLVEQFLTEPEWNAFGREQRQRLGRGGGATFLPWLLDGASSDVIRSVLSRLPWPARLLYRAVWNPRYQRAARRQARPAPLIASTTARAASRDGR